MLVSLQEMLQEGRKKEFRNCIHPTHQPDIPEGGYTGGRRYKHARLPSTMLRQRRMWSPIEIAVPLMLEYARKSTAPISVHVDHGYDFDHCMKAVRLGCTSIMHDNSRFSLRENVERTRRFVDIVHPLGIGVEAELGAMPNNMPARYTARKPVISQI